MELGNAEGVTIPSKADFIFYPVRQAADVKPIVVFTDGYTFHKHRIGQDMAQRMAIVQSGRYRVWSLSFKDVQNEFKPIHPFWCAEWLKERGMMAGGNLGRFWQGFKLQEREPLSGISSFHLLFDFLVNPQPSAWTDMALVYSLCLHSDLKDEIPAPWNEALEKLPGSMADLITGKAGECYIGGDAWDDLSHVITYARSDKSAVMQKAYDRIALIAVLEDDDDETSDGDGFERAWNGYIRTYNLMQFLPGTRFVTRKGVAEYRYDTLSDRAAVIDITPPVVEKRERSNAWADARELAAEELLFLLDAIEARGIEAPAAGDEFTSDGVVIGELELAWYDNRIGVYAAQSDRMLAKLKADGWRLFAMDEVATNHETIIDLFFHAANQ